MRSSNTNFWPAAGSDIPRLTPASVYLTCTGKSTSRVHYYIHISASVLYTPITYLSVLWLTNYSLHHTCLLSYSPIMHERKYWLDKEIVKLQIKVKPSKLVNNATKQNKGELLKISQFLVLSSCMGPPSGTVLWMWQLFVYFEGVS